MFMCEALAATKEMETDSRGASWQEKPGARQGRGGKKGSATEALEALEALFNQQVLPEKEGHGRGRLLRETEKNRGRERTSLPAERASDEESLREKAEKSLGEEMQVLLGALPPKQMQEGTEEEGKTTTRGEEERPEALKFRGKENEEERGRRARVWKELRNGGSRIRSWRGSGRRSLL
jgi:hypothetical protein